jgi:hypothetical protein
MFNPSLPREDIDAQAASTDGRATLYANGQTHMFGRKNCDKKYNCKVQEIYTVQDHPPSPNEPLLLPPLDRLTRLMCEIRSCLSRGILDRSIHLPNVQFLSR